MSLTGKRECPINRLEQALGDDKLILLQGIQEVWYVVICDNYVIRGRLQRSTGNHGEVNERKNVLGSFLHNAL